jgi:hypothetical protein
MARMHAGHGRKVKVFCFFSSEKKTFLPYSAAAANPCRAEGCKYACICAAASRPSRIAHTTRLAPRTISPAANTPGSDVSKDR